MIRLLHNAMNSAVIVRIRFKWWFHCRHPHLKCITQRLKIEINVTLNHYAVLIASSHVCNLIVTDDTTEKIKSFTRNLHAKFYNCQLLSPPSWISKCSLVAASRMTQRSFFWLLGNKAPGSFVSWVVGFVIIPIYKELPAGCGRIWDVMAVFQESPQEYKNISGIHDLSIQYKESKTWTIKCFDFFL